MIGRSLAQDLPRPVLDPQTRFGADSQYARKAAYPYSLTPWEPVPYWATTQASNKPSEHNIQNTSPRLVVAQMAPQTSPPNLRNLISHRAFLNPGNQSLGRT